MGKSKPVEQWPDDEIVQFAMLEIMGLTPNKLKAFGCASCINKCECGDDSLICRICTSRQNWKYDPEYFDPFTAKGMLLVFNAMANIDMLYWEISTGPDTCVVTARIFKAGKLHPLGVGKGTAPRAIAIAAINAIRRSKQ